MKTSFAPQICYMYGQKFTVKMSDNILTLCVINTDGTFKELPISAEITAANPVLPAWLPQPRYQSIVKGQKITCLQRRETSKNLSAKVEREWIENRVATALTYEPLMSLFPENKHVQYAD